MIIGLDSGSMSWFHPIQAYLKHTMSAIEVPQKGYKTYI